jgi:Putative bacterial lipoprotein (DUF799)
VSDAEAEAGVCSIKSIRSVTNGPIHGAPRTHASEGTTSLNSTRRSVAIPDQNYVDVHHGRPDLHSSYRTKDDYPCLPVELRRHIFCSRIDVVLCLRANRAEQATQVDEDKRLFTDRCTMGRWFWLGFVSLTCSTIGCSTTNYETLPFYQSEYGVEAHGRKTSFDHLVEIDPGAFKVTVAADYLQQAPARVAVLPFTDLGSANFLVDKMPLTHRNGAQRNQWAWTDSQRLRRALDGYLAQREFFVTNLNGVDAVLYSRGINNAEKLYQLSPQELGDLLGVDAIVYGAVESYEAYYFGLVAGWRVGVDIKMVSTKDGAILVEAQGSRYDTSLMIALSPVDILISSAENVLQLRDINLARSEEETCREIVHRIPVSSELQKEDAQAALNYAKMESNRQRSSLYPPNSVGLIRFVTDQE